MATIGILSTIPDEKYLPSNQVKIQSFLITIQAMVLLGLVYLLHDQRELYLLSVNLSLAIL